MSNLFLQERNPFDILVRNFFQDASTFAPLSDYKVPHPVDIFTTDTGLTFEVACTGISKEEIEIQTQDNILRINYNKSKEDDLDVEYIYKGIAKRSFNLGWKIDSKFELSKANAEFKNGLLTIKIPYAKESLLKVIEIK